MRLFLPAFFALAAAVTVTPLVRALAQRLGALDRPGPERKIHRQPTPLLGGLAVFLAVAAAVAAAGYFGLLPGGYVKTKYLFGIITASALLVIGGILDDKYDLKPSRQIIWPALAALVVIASGIGVKYVSNPFGGQFFLDRYAATILTWDGVPYRLTLLADLFTFVWLMGTTYTTKLLDGLDGLVAGLAAIGGIIIAAVSLMREVSQPDTAVLALIVAGAFLGFLVYNFHPASIFLGEGGSTLAGFLLGALAVIAGGKIATTLLILGLPLLDALLVVARRVINRSSPLVADSSHLHLRLLSFGLSHRRTVLFYYFVAALFGASTLVLKGREKIAVLGALLALLLFFAVISARSAKKRSA